MVQLAQRIQVERLSVRKTEELVREYLSGAREARPHAAPATERDAGRVRRGLAAHARSARTARQGQTAAQGRKCEIRFREKEELDALLTLLSPERP